MTMTMTNGHWLWPWLWHDHDHDYDHSQWPWLRPRLFRVGMFSSSSQATLSHETKAIIILTLYQPECLTCTNCDCDMKKSHPETSSNRWDLAALVQVDVFVWNRNWEPKSPKKYMWLKLTCVAGSSDDVVDEGGDEAQVVFAVSVTLPCIAVIV